MDGARTLAELIKRAGHQVEYAINGYVAVDMARRLRPEVIFLDIGLPGINGYDVCRLLRREAGLEKTVIVAVTAYGEQQDRERALAAGCHDHLVKPVATETLLTLIEQS